MAARSASCATKTATARYETVRLLSEGLPAAQSALRASNGIVQAPDGRLFTVDINSGEILKILLRE